MIPRIKSVKSLENYVLEIVFDDGKEVLYDMNDDIDILPGYDDLKSIPYLYKQVSLDESRTCVYWTEDIDLPSDMLYEYGKTILRPIAKKVIPKENYILDITFNNGERKMFDVKPYIQGEWYGKLKDIEYFRNVALDCFTVVWPDGQDICPDELYENSKKVEE